MSEVVDTAKTAQAALLNDIDGRLDRFRIRAGLYAACALVGVAGVMAVLSPWLGTRWALASVALSASILALASIFAVSWISCGACWLAVTSGWVAIVTGQATEENSKRIDKQLMQALDFGTMKVQ